MIRTACNLGFVNNWKKTFHIIGMMKFQIKAVETGFYHKSFNVEKGKDTSLKHTAFPLLK